MSSLKRSRPGSLLGRRVRPRKDDDSDNEVPEDRDETPSNDSQSAESGPSEDDDESEIGEDVSDEGSENGVADPKLDISQVSFGALAKAQASLPPLKKRKSAAGQISSEEPNLRPARTSDEREKSKAKAAAAAAAKRSSKHAPMEVTSKKPVSRKRDIVEIHKVKARDPRFDPIPGQAPVDEEKARRAYAFLDEYRDSEMKELKAASRKENDPRRKEAIQRAVMSWESKKKAQDRKDREKKVIEEHRKQEKELVKQGKKPFYLKKSEQKKRLLLDEYAGLSKKKVDKVIERRRKKLASKEKKDLPFMRRGAESST